MPRCEELQRKGNLEDWRLKEGCWMPLGYGPMRKSENEWKKEQKRKDCTNSNP